MPIYVYRFVDTGETIEVPQAFTDETLTEAVHPATGERMPVKKVFTPVGVTFKGNGFYKTDSRASSRRIRQDRGQGSVRPDVGLCGRDFGRGLGRGVAGGQVVG